MGLSFKEIVKKEKEFNKKPTTSLFLVVSEAYRKTGDLKKARQVCLKGLQLFPDCALGHLTLARILMDLNEYDLCLNQLEEVIELSNDNLLAYYLMGEAYLKKGHPKNALACYKMILFYRPRDRKVIQAIRNLEYLDAQGYPHLDSSFSASQSFLSRPSVKKDWIAYSDTLIARGDYEEAKMTLEKALDQMGPSLQILRRIDHLKKKQKTPSSFNTKERKIDQLKKMLHKLERKEVAGEVEEKNFFLEV